MLILGRKKAKYMEIFIYLESLLYNISEFNIKIGKNIFFTSSHTLYFQGMFYPVCAQICHLLKQVMGEIFSKYAGYFSQYLQGQFILPELQLWPLINPY